MLMEASRLSKKEARVVTICLGGRVSSVGEVVPAVGGAVCSVAAVVSGGGSVDSTLASLAVSGGGSSAPGDVAAVCAGADPVGSAADAVSTGVKQDSTSISTKKMAAVRLMVCMVYLLVIYLFRLF